MTPFNHCKYHFTRGIPIPSRASEKTKAHRVRSFKSTWRLAAGGDAREELRGFSRRTVSVWNGLMGTRWKDRNLLPQNDEFDVPESAQRWYLFFDSSIKTFVEPWWRWPSDSSWWIRSKAQFSACPMSQCQNYLVGRFVWTLFHAGRTDIYSLCKSLSSWDV